MPLKVLFLSSDTGGGHRASAESLANQFKLLFPGSTYDLLDVQSKDGVPPYNNLVGQYKHLSAHPQQWNLVFKFSNSKAFEFFFDVTQKALCEKAMRQSIMEYNPDVVVSVHPLMTNVPALCCEKISKETGRHLPIFTVVTDLGSAHCLWFYNGVDKMFIASDQCRHLAKVRGKVPDEKLVQIGLPIRHQFAEQAEKLGDRMSLEGQEYQRKLRGELGLPAVHKKSVLVMGGGEGVGSLSNIVNALYVEFEEQGIDAVIMVCCGRNEKLKKDLAERDWDKVVKEYLERKERRIARRNLSEFSLSSCVTGAGIVGITSTSSGCMEGSVTQQIRKILSSSSMKGLGKEKAITSKHESYPKLVNDHSEETNYENVPEINRLPTVEDDDEKREEDEEESIKEKNDELAEESRKSNESQEADESDDFTTTGVSVEETKTLHEAAEDIYAKKKSVSSTILKRGEVNVVGLGFITNMADYMVVADVLVSKAGPGTIAEAAALSLPVMLTSFLPGQEEGNVDFVVNGGFGAYISDKDPTGVAEEVGQWLTSEEMSKNLSRRAKANGAPNAARDIVEQIGKISLKWKQINDDREQLDKAAEQLMQGDVPSNDIKL